MLHDSLNLLSMKSKFLDLMDSVNSFYTIQIGYIFVFFHILVLDLARLDELD